MSPTTPVHHLETVARNVFTQAMTEGRCGELLEALWNGAGCTLDPIARRLVILSAETLATAFPDNEAADTPARTPFAAVTEGIAGAGTPAELQPTGWSRVAVPFPPGTTVAVGVVNPDSPHPTPGQVTCRITDDPDGLPPRVEVQGTWQVSPAGGGYHALVEVATDELLPTPAWCAQLTEDTGVHLFAPDAARCLCGNRTPTAATAPPPG